MATLVSDRVRVRPSGAVLGADVEGIDFARLTAEEMAAVRVALLEHKVIRVRGAAVDDVAFTRFAEGLGELHHTPDYSRSRKVYVAEAPFVTIVSNVTENGQPIGDQGDGELNWHTDLGFTEVPTQFTFLVAREVPAAGGDTSFADMYAAHDAMPEALRARVAQLGLKHQRSHDSVGRKRPGYRDIETDDPRELPGPVHPILRTHPETGRKALYLGRRFGAYIPGLPLAKSEALVDELWSYAARPEHVWTQRWQVGDLVVWDNRCTMHRRESFAGQGRRRLHRLQTRGDRPR
jgi:taurine dioxygenase